MLLAEKVRISNCWEPKSSLIFYSRLDEMWLRINRIINFVLWYKEQGFVKFIDWSVRDDFENVYKLFLMFLQ